MTTVECRGILSSRGIRVGKLKVAEQRAAVTNLYQQEGLVPPLLRTYGTHYLRGYLLASLYTPELMHPKEDPTVSGASTSTAHVDPFTKRGMQAQEYNGLSTLNQELPAFKDELVGQWYSPKRHYTESIKSNSESLGYNLAFTLPKIVVSGLSMRISHAADDGNSDGVVQFILPSMIGTGTDKSKPKTYRVTFWASVRGADVVAVLGAQCSCCAGGTGMCKHVAALMYIVAAVKPDKACTDKLMEWQMSHAEPFDVKQPVYMLRVQNHEKGRDKQLRAVSLGKRGRHKHYGVVMDPNDPGFTQYCMDVHEKRTHLYSLLASYNVERNPYREKKQKDSLLQDCDWKGECMAQIQWPEGPNTQMRARKKQAVENAGWNDLSEVVGLMGKDDPVDLGIDYNGLCDEEEEEDEDNEL